MIRVKYYDNAISEIIFDGEYLNIKKAEKIIAKMYRMGCFNDDDGKLSVYVDGVEKEFKLYGKITEVSFKEERLKSTEKETFQKLCE